MSETIPSNEVNVEESSKEIIKKEEVNNKEIIKNDVTYQILPLKIFLLITKIYFFLFYHQTLFQLANSSLKSRSHRLL